MATKHVCDICASDASHALFIEDGGTQRDIPSGRTEETGDNLDLCTECLLKAYRVAVGKTPAAQQHFHRHVTRAVGRVWKGKE